MTLSDLLQSARPRRFQFSLKTLLLAVGAAAILFGLVLPLANWAFIVETEWHETAMRKEIPQSEVYGDLKSIAFLCSALVLICGCIVAIRQFNAGKND